jgi:hypothetical protein
MTVVAKPTCTMGCTACRYGWRHASAAAGAAPTTMRSRGMICLRAEWYLRANVIIM